MTEIPYQVNKRMLIKNMADQVNEKRLDGISDIRDESDRTGMRIVVELKRDANAQVVLNRLFAQTQLQTTFAICGEKSGLWRTCPGCGEPSGAGGQRCWL